MNVKLESARDKTAEIISYKARLKTNLSASNSTICLLKRNETLIHKKTCIYYIKPKPKATKAKTNK